MAKGSAAPALLGGLCGVLLALLAIFIGSMSTHIGGESEPTAAHHAE